MNTISSNIANANVTKTPEGGPYRRKDAVFQSIPQQESFGEILDDMLEGDLQRVQVAEVSSDQGPPRLVYNPSHPEANQQGYVAMPNVNPVEEMVNMLNSSRSYEANVTAMDASKAMAMKALEIGK
jgi:flagellar basal-body rod protein FlgC